MRRRSPKQQAASRTNGSRSQGPVTPQGKRQSSQNSRSHGLYARAILLPGESEAAFHRIASELDLRFNPQDTLESMLVQRMILAQWRLIRVWSLEQAGMMQAAPQTVPQATPDLTPSSIHPAARDLAAFQILHGQGRSGSLLQLSELRYQRQFDRAILQLEHLRKSASAQQFEGTNLTSSTKQTEIPENTEPGPIPSRPAAHPSATQTDPPPTQNEPTVHKPAE